MVAVASKRELVAAAASAPAVERDRVADIQRARIVSAMFEVACERGAANVTVGALVERSGVSRRTFYEMFSDREECFLAALEEALQYAAGRVLPAYRASGRWQERIRQGLIELLALFDDEPLLARLLVCESLAAGPRALARRREVLALLVQALEAEWESGENGSRKAPPLAAEGVLGGVLSVVHSRLLSPSEEPLVELSGALAAMVFLPYLGARAAQREHERPVPAPRSRERDSALLRDPFKQAGMRLTYRTVRVMMTIADSPGASNRTVCEASDIKDQGQASKLLARLQRAGLVCNSGLGPGQGAPNAWALTASGERVVRGIRARVPSEAGV